MADEEKDDLRADLMSAFESAGKSEPTEQVAEEPVVESTELVETEVEKTQAERNRDDQGRFAKEKKQRETLTLKPKDEKPVAVKPETETPVDPKAVKPEAAKPTDERVPPPTAWMGSEKVRWERLPKEVQTAIAKDYQRMSQEAQVGKEAAPILQALSGARDLLIQEGGSIPGGVHKLLELSNWASRQPYDFLPAFIQQRGLNFPALAAKLGYQVVSANGQQPVNQAVPQSLPPEILQRLQRVDQLEAQFKGQQTAATQAEIQSFIDNPAHPYVADVQDEMIAVMEAQKLRGERPNLDKAYEAACRMNPAVWAQLQAQTQVQPTNQQAVEAARAAKAASLNGSPVPGSGGEVAKDEDLRSAIAKQVYASYGGQRV